MDRRQFLGSVAAGAVLAGCGQGTETASTKEDLATIDGLGLAGRIKAGDLTAKEATQAAIERIEKLDGPVNAVVTKLFDRALTQSEGALGDGPFAGVPYLLKDLLDYEGVPLIHGSKLMAQHISDWTPPFVEALEASGLNILGKTNTPEFGLLATTESRQSGPCHNPWNLDHSTGGSSGGAAAAVAAGMLPVAQASDGGGSIRIPASCCGLFGLKPSRGRMMETSKVPMPGDIGVRHCVSRSVRDSAMLFAVTEQHSPDSTFPPVGFVKDPSKDRLKIAFNTMNYLGDEPDADVKAALEETAKLCADLGHEVIETPTPIDGQAFVDAFLLIWASGPAQLKAMVEAQTGAPAEATGLLEPWTLGLADFFNSKPQGSFEAAVASFADFTREYNDYMANFDIWLTPVLKHSPPELGWQAPTHEFNELYDRVTNYVSYTPLHNAVGAPSMSVPLGWNEAGLPIGSQFAAKLGEEAKLFALAYELEQARPWKDKWAPHSIVNL